MRTREARDISPSDLPARSKKFFEKRYIPEPMSGCWIWLGGITDQGYGTIHIRPLSHLLAHRISWVLHRGALSGGVFVLHRCDNPTCVNPDHLFLGDHDDNMADMCGKKRNAIGERNGGAKLTPDQIEAIRLDTRSLRAIAEDFAICVQNVSDIQRGVLWGQSGSVRPTFPQYGEGVRWAKLTERQVRSILIDPRTQQAIADEYGVSREMISRIKRRLAWKHIQDGANQ